MNKGTCSNCGRKDIGIVAKGLCGTCYAVARGLEGEEREKALAVAREKILTKKREDHEDRQDRIKDEEAARAAEKAQEAIKEAAEGKTITLNFRGPDMEIYHALDKTAQSNRRLIENEAITILEAGLQDSIFGVKQPGA